MAVTLDRMTAEEIKNNLINGKEDVNNLNLAKLAHREGFVAALQTRPHILGHVEKENVAHFVKYALRKDYKYFLYLKRAQYTDEILQIYLINRLREENQKMQKENGGAQNFKYVVEQSLDGKILLQYNYVTVEGEELYYMDKELQVPLSLKSSLKIQVKITDAIALIEKLDVEVAQLGLNRICGVFSDIIGQVYKCVLREFMEKRKIGYYTLCTELGELSEMLSKELETVLKEYGVKPQDCIVRKIGIPKDMQFKLENQAFDLRKQRIAVEADTEFAKQSLEYYEAKLALQAKYPDATQSLTEYEKDLALKRYLIKQGRLQEEEHDHSIKLVQKLDKQDEKIATNEDVIPVIEKKKDPFKKTFAFWLSACLLTAIIMMAAGAVGGGLIVLGLTCALFGTIGALCKHRFVEQDVEVDENNEGAEQMSKETNAVSEGE